MKDGDVAARGLGVRKRPDVAAQVVVDGQREEIGRVTLAAQHAAHPARAVADGVPAMGRGHPLVDDHRRARSSALGARGSGIGDQRSGVVPTLDPVLDP